VCGIDQERDTALSGEVAGDLYGLIKTALGEAFGVQGHGDEGGSRAVGETGAKGVGEKRGKV
jgi:hypothetical protein